MAGALAFVVGVPALSHAQQSGLFPLAPIQRERVPCPIEDPVYKLYRHQYFGYHPTCWRRFPSGWGCPSPEAPNPAASFREIPRDVPPAEPGDEAQPKPGGEEMGPDRPRTPQPPGNLPPLPPGDRSPFDLDNKPDTPPVSNPPGDKPGGGRNPANPVPPADPGAGADETPPTIEPTPPVSAPASSTTPDESASSRNPGGDDPALALPDPTASPTSTTVAGGVANDSRTQAPASPAVAPRRQSLLSSLFGGLRRR